jgi:DNA-binding protein H-NS
MTKTEFVELQVKYREIFMTQWDKYIERYEVEEQEQEEEQEEEEDEIINLTEEVPNE